MNDIQGKTLLLVEDDQSLREVLTEEFQERGLQVSAFAQNTFSRQSAKSGLGFAGFARWALKIAWIFCVN